MLLSRDHSQRRASMSTTYEFLTGMLLRMPRGIHNLPHRVA